MSALSVIVVSWNVRDLLRACLRSVHSELALAGLAGSAEVFVVDNASHDGSAAMVRADFPAVQLMANDHNAGFGLANNQALTRSSGYHVLLLNPDAALQPGALGALLDFLDAHPGAGCVGPMLRNPDGSLQPSRRSFPALSTALVESTVLQRYLRNVPALRRYYRANARDDVAQPVDWLVGACLLLRGEVLRQLGGFDERFFMYSEEMDLCFRLREAGYETWFVPRAVVIHHEAASSSQDVLRRNISFHQSRFRFFQKHHGVPAAQLLRWFTFGTFLYQLAEESAKFAVRPAKRAMRRERIAMYVRIVKWYLSAF